MRMAISRKNGILATTIYRSGEPAQIGCVPPISFFLLLGVLLDEVVHQRVRVAGLEPPRADLPLWRRRALAGRAGNRTDEVRAVLVEHAVERRLAAVLLRRRQCRHVLHLR